jgi:hypothetical protein
VPCIFAVLWWVVLYIAKHRTSPSAIKLVKVQRDKGVHESPVSWRADFSCVGAPGRPSTYHTESRPAELQPAPAHQPRGLPAPIPL